MFVLYFWIYYRHFFYLGTKEEKLYMYKITISKKKKGGGGGSKTHMSFYELQLAEQIKTEKR